MRYLSYQFVLPLIAAGFLTGAIRAGAQELERSDYYPQTTFPPTETPTITPRPSMTPSPTPSATPEGTTPTPSRTPTPTPFPCDPDTVQFTVLAETPQAYAAFGGAVAASGSLAIASAPHDSHTSYYGGAAFIFDTTTGERLFSLYNPLTIDNDQFGSSVAISGDLAVVGGLHDPFQPVLNAGAAYVYNALTGEFIAHLRNPSPAEHDYFAYSVAISGDTALVGARQKTLGHLYSGAAYLFNARTGELLRTITNPNSGDILFGGAVAISGDIAVIAGGGVPQHGSAHLFDVATGQLLRSLHEDPLVDGPQFGYAVAISGNTVVVGVRSDTNGGFSNSGAAYLFEASTGAQIARIVNPSPAVNDYFGWAVAIDGERVVIGAYSHKVGALNSAGAAYLYDAATGAYRGELPNPQPAGYAYFGAAVAIAGNTAVVGSYNKRVDPDPGAGTVDIINCESLIPTPSPTATPYDARAIGDYDGSNCTELADFLYLLDYWQIESPLGGEPLGLGDFLALLDNWQLGAGC